MLLKINNNYHQLYLKQPIHKTRALNALRNQIKQRVCIIYLNLYLIMFPCKHFPLGLLMCTFMQCVFYSSLAPLSLFWLSGNYSLPSSTQNSPLPSTRHTALRVHVLIVWTRLTLFPLDFGTVSSCPEWELVSLETSFTGVMQTGVFTVFFIFPKNSPTHSFDFSHGCRVC